MVNDATTPDRQARSADNNGRPGAGLDEHVRQNNAVDPAGVTAIRQAEAGRSVPAGQFVADEKLLVAFQEKNEKPGRNDDVQRGPERDAQHIKGNVALSEINDRLDGDRHLENPAKAKLLASSIISGDINEVDRVLKNMPNSEFTDTVLALKSAFKDSGLFITSRTAGTGQEFVDKSVSGTLILSTELHDGESKEAVVLSTIANEKPKGANISLGENGLRISYSRANEELNPKPDEVGNNIASTAVDKMTNSVQQTAKDLQALEQVPLFLPFGVDKDQNGKLSLREVENYQRANEGTDEAKQLEAIVRGFDNIAGNDGQISMAEFENYRLGMMERATALAAADLVRGQTQNAQNLPNLLYGLLSDERAAAQFEHNVDRMLSSGNMNFKVGPEEKDDRRNTDRQLHFIGPDGRVLRSVAVPVRRTR